MNYSLIYYSEIYNVSMIFPILIIKNGKDISTKLMSCNPHFLFKRLYYMKNPRNSIHILLQGTLLSHKLIPSPDNRLDHIRVSQLSPKLANYIINHMLTSGHVPPAIQIRKFVLKKVSTLNTFLTPQTYIRSQPQFLYTHPRSSS